MRMITAHSCAAGCGETKKRVLRKEQDGSGNGDIALCCCG